MRTLRYVTLGMVSATLFSSVAFACTCMRAESAADQMASVDIVFEGRAVEVKQDREDRSFFHRIQSWLGFNNDLVFSEDITTFEVFRTLKGESLQTVHVRHTSGSHGGMCGVSFPKEQDVLILAHKDAEGQYSTNLCSLPQFPIENFLSVNDADAE